MASIKIRGRQGELGLWLRPAFQERGVGTAAFAALVQIAHEELRLARLLVDIESSNTKALAVVRRAGFVPCEPEPSMRTGCLAFEHRR